MSDKLDMPLCPSCLIPNDPTNDFCVACGTPLRSFSEIDPLRQIRSEGDTLQKAQENPSAIVLLGQWLIWGVPGGTAVIILVWMALSFCCEPFGRVTFCTVAAMMILFALCGGYAWIASVNLYRTTRNFLIAGASARPARRSRRRRKARR